MARQYSRLTFLRQTPHKLLKQFFEQQRIGLGLDWEALAQRDVATVNTAMEALDPAVLRQIDAEFSTITEMACEDGVHAILEEAELWNLNWSDRFAEMGSHFERAMWAYLNQRQRFDAAEMFHEMDRLKFGWHRFVGTRLEVQGDEASREAMGADIVAFYRKKGMGRRCQVDTYRREGPERYCFFAYPESAVDTELGYDDQNRLGRRPRQAAFEVIFVYRPEEGMLDLYARGGKPQKEALARIFCRRVLGLTGLPDEDERVPFDLSRFKDPTFEFRTDPADRVQGVDVRLIRLDLPFDRKKGTGRRITLECKSTADSPRALYGLIAEAINPYHIRMADAQVGRIKLCFTFRPVGKARAKTLTFEVGYPDRCTLTDAPHDQIARKYLREWGIARPARAEVAAAAG